MRTRSIVGTVVLFVGGIFLANGAALADGKRYWDKVSGAIADGSTSMDLNGDGVPAGYAAIVGRSNLGRVDGWLILELDPLNPGVCDDGSVQFPVVNGTGVRRIRGGSLLYLQDNSGFVCLDPTTGATTSQTEGVFSGGTGRFAGAGGAYRTRGTGNLLMSDGVASFVAFTFSTRGAVTTP